MSSPIEQTADLGALLRDGRAEGRWTLEPAASRAEFWVKHFWGAMTVHGWFEQIQGEGTVTRDGRVAGRVSIRAASLQTKHAQRDRHLRSIDFFDAELHPEVLVEITEARPVAMGELAAKGTLTIAGHQQPVEFRVQVDNLTRDEARLGVELTLDRTKFDMTWSPIGMASKQARLTASLRFTRQRGQ
jgi:polyisoprenoid-binding protein YceI